MDFLFFHFSGFYDFLFFMSFSVRALLMREALAAAAAYVLGAAGVRALALGFSTSRAYTCLTVTALTERMVINRPWWAHSRLIFRCDLCGEWLALCSCNSRLCRQSVRAWRY